MDSSSAKIFFESFVQQPALSFRALPQSGSSRINYLGEAEGKKFIVTYNENIRENEAFFYFSNVFAQKNLNTPKILSINPQKNLYVQEFVGEKTLSEIIAEEGLTPRVEKLVKLTLEKLFSLQEASKNEIDFSNTFEYEKYDDLPIMHDLYYFKNFLIDVLEIPYHKSSLLKEFKHLSEKISLLSPRGLMIRDFQARNILVHQEEVFFIDYQSAMEGPVIYDVVSFLFQAKAQFPEAFKNEMLGYYFSFFKDPKEIALLEEALPYCKLIRYLQVLGAYGFRGLIQRKSHFLDSIAVGINNVVNFAAVDSSFVEYPELKKLICLLHTEGIKEKIQNIIR